MTLRRRLLRILLILLFFPPLFAGVAGWLAGPSFLHPIRRELTPDLVREADATFAYIHAKREEFDVRAWDGALLRGWRVVPEHPNGSWVLVFHGVADNRMGVIGQAEMLLRGGYSVVMMDIRAHGASDGAMATYGWLERKDATSVIDALLASENLAPNRNRVADASVKPVGTVSSASFSSVNSSISSTASRHIFALGESMGAGIALQCAAADPRIEAVVAEAPFASLQEAAYDYAGLGRSPWLGKTIFAPGAWAMVYRGERLAGFSAANISPEKSVASRAFPVFLICDANDVTLPCRHAERIYAAARGPKEFWMVPGAFHTAALGYQPEEFKRRVLAFFTDPKSASSPALR